MYGTQAIQFSKVPNPLFENDVKMYGTQAPLRSTTKPLLFENDVKMYGTQAGLPFIVDLWGLRMM